MEARSLPSSEVLFSKVYKIVRIVVHLSTRSGSKDRKTPQPRIKLYRR